MSPPFVGRFVESGSGRGEGRSSWASLRPRSAVDGHHPIMEMQLGPVRVAVDPRAKRRRRPFAHKLVVRHSSRREPTTPSIQDLYAALRSTRA